MEILAMQKRINEVMMENHIRGDIVDYNTREKMIAVEITRGDWKHDHLRMDYFMQTAYDIRSIQTQTTEENGSDCYSAIHYYYFN